MQEINNMSGTYVLIAEPAPTGVQSPIGPFKGTLYGKGRTVTKQGSFNCIDDHAGLFGVIDGGKVYDLKIVALNLEQNTQCGHIGLLAAKCAAMRGRKHQCH